MSIVIAGGIFGGILVYQNSEYFILNGLKVFSYLQHKYENMVIFENKLDNNPEKIKINNKTLYIYKRNNKEFYSWENNIQDQIINEKSVYINPIMDITLKINNEIINCDIINKFIHLNTIILNKNTLETIWIPLINKLQNKDIKFCNKYSVNWEVLDTDFRTFNGESLKLIFENNKLIVINEI